MAPKTDDFNAQQATATLKQENEGVHFYKKVEESLKSSVHVRDEVKNIFWEFFKEKIGWIIAGGFALVCLELLRELGSHLINKI